MCGAANVTGIKKIAPMIEGVEKRFLLRQGKRQSGCFLSD